VHKYRIFPFVRRAEHNMIPVLFVILTTTIFDKVASERFGGWAPPGGAWSPWLQSKSEVSGTDAQSHIDISAEAIGDTSLICEAKALNQACKFTNNGTFVALPIGAGAVVRWGYSAAHVTVRCYSTSGLGTSFYVDYSTAVPNCKRSHAAAPPLVGLQKATLPDTPASTHTPEPANGMPTTTTFIVISVVVTAIAVVVLLLFAWHRLRPTNASEESTPLQQP
jgi:hypothetical protein